MHSMFALRVSFVSTILTAIAMAQTPSLPAKLDPFQLRFVDFHRDLERKDLVVVVGTLGKAKEIKRVRLSDGKSGEGQREPLFGANDAKIVRGSRFKVSMQAKVQPRATFTGKADKIMVSFDVRIARLTDDTLLRESTTIGGSMEERMFAMFLLTPRDRGDGHDVLRVISDHRMNKDPESEARFVDAVGDYYAINRRMLDLQTALDAAEEAKDDVTKKSTMAVLQKVVDEPLSLRCAQNNSLTTEHVAPLEQRAKKKIADAAPTPEK